MGLSLNGLGWVLEHSSQDVNILREEAAEEFLVRLGVWEIELGTLEPERVGAQVGGGCLNVFEALMGNDFCFRGNAGELGAE